MKLIGIIFFLFFQISFCWGQREEAYIASVEEYLKMKNPFPEEQNEDIKGKYFVREVRKVKYKSKESIILAFGFNYTHVSIEYIMIFTFSTKKSEVIGGTGLKKDAEDLKNLISQCKKLDIKTTTELYDIIIENNLPVNETKIINRKN